MRGTVRELRAIKRNPYGFIYGDDGKMYYFRFSDPTDYLLDKGNRVEFEAIGEKALDIRPVERLKV